MVLVCYRQWLIGFSAGQKLQRFNTNYYYVSEISAPKINRENKQKPSQ